jgi:hypothetical protein
MANEHLQILRQGIQFRGSQSRSLDWIMRPKPQRGLEISSAAWDPL